MPGQNGERKVSDPMMLVAAGFAAGLVAGLFLKPLAQQIRGVARGTAWPFARARTVEYDNNLPDQLTRREVEGQPRYGGTGALGVSPKIVRNTH